MRYLIALALLTACGNLARDKPADTTVVTDSAVMTDTTKNGKTCVITKRGKVPFAQVGESFRPCLKGDTVDTIK